MWVCDTDRFHDHLSYIPSSVAYEKPRIYCPWRCGRVFTQQLEDIGLAPVAGTGGVEGNSPHFDVHAITWALVPMICRFGLELSLCSSYKIQVTLVQLVTLCIVHKRYLLFCLPAFPLSSSREKFLPMFQPWSSRESFHFFYIALPPRTVSLFETQSEPFLAHLDLEPEKSLSTSLWASF
jgi:hypothetical protein